jgi:hypothetical protein
MVVLLLWKADGDVTLDECANNIGNRVVHLDRYSNRSTNFGVITSVGTRYVFVRVDDDTASQACYPERLDLRP